MGEFSDLLRPDGSSPAAPALQPSPLDRIGDAVRGAMQSAGVAPRVARPVKVSLGEILSLEK